MYDSYYYTYGISFWLSGFVSYQIINYKQLLKFTRFYFSFISTNNQFLENFLAILSQSRKCTFLCPLKSHVLIITKSIKLLTKIYGTRKLLTGIIIENRNTRIRNFHWSLNERSIKYQSAATTNKAYKLSLCLHSGP